jgi:hypothetical protein
MIPTLKVVMYVGDKAVETWTYYPEEKVWRDDLEADDIPTNEVISNDIAGAIEHAVSVQDGTHP